MLGVVWRQVGAALDRAALVCVELGVVTGALGEANDLLGSLRVEGFARAVVAAWHLQERYLVAERSLESYFGRLGMSRPPRTVEFPGRPAVVGVDPRIYFRPVVIEVPRIAAGVPDLRGAGWAERVRWELPAWDLGDKTEGKIYDESAKCWKLLSGVDRAESLTGEARYRVLKAIRDGLAPGDPKYAKGLGIAATHVETKAAVWARRTGRALVDVVTNRNYVCGQAYRPGISSVTAGCAQAVRLILVKGQTMRVWCDGREVPLIIEGEG
ncbi:DddA-like double-stranded DNA deaminase toxin [Saccharothrix violaceirubra]|uniref:Uncharacterized protein n=1 Tax=Saccharothrix violaceirubra TaxID=413306 RepID=A0A7W7T8Y7_9PSEU|nr:DddA-like double-stranded DNA deaminase toxin [Saccharothrix violaceirubra]MBB4968768.1 hypothetical protein [Saccharothrix violaceirubra]